MTRTTQIRAALLLVATLAAPVAQAVVSCTVSASGVNFGIYNPLSAAPLDSTGSVTVTCTLQSGGATTVNMIAKLSAGSSGSFAARTMVSGVQQLKYNLYWSNAYAQVWGDGTGGSFYGTATLALTAANPTQQANGTMYGQIPAAQDVGAGSYLDTIVVTVSY